METIAVEIIRISRHLNIEIIFKTLFDKSIRTSVHSFRGPGLEKGLLWLNDIRLKHKLHVKTVIHEFCQAASVGEIVDIIKIPTFYFRQFDLLIETAKTGKIVKIKKT